MFSKKKKTIICSLRYDKNVFFPVWSLNSEKGVKIGLFLVGSDSQLFLSVITIYKRSPSILLIYFICLTLLFEHFGVCDYFGILPLTAFHI